MHLMFWRSVISGLAKILAPIWCQAIPPYSADLFHLYQQEPWEWINMNENASENDVWHTWLFITCHCFKCLVSIWFAMQCRLTKIIIWGVHEQSVTVDHELFFIHSNNTALKWKCHKSAAPKLSFWQLSMPPVVEMSLAWSHLYSSEHWTCVKYHKLWNHKIKFHIPSLLVRYRMFPVRIAEKINCVITLSWNLSLEYRFHRKHICTSRGPSQ